MNGAPRIKDLVEELSESKANDVLLSISGGNGDKGEGVWLSDIAITLSKYNVCMWLLN